MTGTISVDAKTQTYKGTQQPTPEILLLHTTEGTSWPYYAGGNESPHVTVKPLPGRGIEVRVHRPWTDYAKALANRAGGVETNRRGVLQIELMGTCDPRSSNGYFWPGADDVVLAALADYVRPVLARFNIPARTIATFLPYPVSYGSRGGQRLTFSQWNSARGICGHQHAPENDHGDPGAFPIDRFVAHLTDQTIPTTDTTEDDMPWTDALPVMGSDKKQSAAYQLTAANVYSYRANRKLDQVLAQLTGVMAALEAVAASKGGDPKQIADVVDKAVRDRLAQFTITDEADQ